MSNNDLALQWEWPAGRNIESKLLLKIEKITPASKGFLGLGASPSLAGALPDATDVSATVLAGPAQIKGQPIKVQLPGLEARKLKPGQFAGAGLLAGNAILVCLAAAPAQEQAAALTWLQSWDCKQAD